MLNTILNKLRGNFTKNIVLLTSGTALSQILNMFFSPMITRLYTPDEYGVLSIYIAVLSTLSFIGTLNYDMGIPIAEDDEKAINLLVISIIALISSLTLLVTVFILSGPQLLNFLNANTLVNYIYLIPIGLFLKGIYSIFVQWAYRDKDFKTITHTKLTQTIFKNGTKLFFGVIVKGPIGLLIGHIVGECSGIFALAVKPIIKKKYLINKIKKSELISLAKTYKDFPLYTTPRRYLGDVTISMPIILLTTLHGSQVAGFYGLANTIIQMPMNLIGNSISDVYYAECAALKNSNPEGIQTLSNKLLKVLIIIGLIPLIILMLWGPSLFGLVYGAEWSEAGDYARILSISIFARFIFKPISNIFDIFEKQKFAFIINIFRIVLVFLVFGISMYLNFSIYVTISFYSIAMAFVYFVQYVGAQKVIKEAILKK